MTSTIWIGGAMFSGLPLVKTRQDLEQIIRSNIRSRDGILVNTLNTYSYVEAQRNPPFRRALESSNALVADGVGITLAWRMLGDGAVPQRLTGYDLFVSLMTCLQDEGGKVLFVGSTDSTLARIKLRFSQEYPRVEFHCYSPPFTEHFGEDELAKMTSLIGSVDPDVLLMGLTAPKQELLLDLITDRIKFGIGSGIGAVFDYYAGTRKRPGRLVRALGLEWAARLIQDPRKIGHRVFVGGWRYAGYIVKGLLNRGLASRQ